MADKCGNVKPFPYPGNGCDVSPMKEGEPLRMSDAERAFFDSNTTEQAQIAGTPIEYWLIDVKNSHSDTLYGEPIERGFAGPYKFFGIFSAPSISDIVAEEGISKQFTADVAIPRKSFEDLQAGQPGPGDVLRVWDLPMYVALSTSEPEPLPGSGYFFDVLNVTPDGYIVDSPTFARYSLRLKRRTTFTPERRLKRP